MPLSNPSLLTGSTSSTDASSYNTASVTPTAGALLIVVVNTRFGSAVPNTPSVTRAGGGETFTLVDTRDGWIADRTKLSVFRAVGVASAGALTFDFSGQTQTQCSWIVAEITGQDTTTPVVQSVDNGGSGTSGSLALSAFADATNNMSLAAWAKQIVQDVVPDSGNSWAEVTQVDQAENGLVIALHYRQGEDTSPTASWASSHSWGGVGMEIAVAAAAGGYTPRLTLLGVG